MKVSEILRRVYHPTLSTWHDIPEGAAAEWAEAGWLIEKPGHVDDSEALPAGEGFVPASLPVDDAPDQLNKPCPYCGADPGEPCVTSAGVETSPHAPRRQ